MRQTVRAFLPHLLRAMSNGEDLTALSRRSRYCISVHFPPIRVDSRGVHRGAAERRSCRAVWSFFGWSLTMATSDGSLLTPQRVAELFGISRRTLYNWVQRGLFPQPLRLGPGGRTLSWTPSQIANQFKATREPSPNSRMRYAGLCPGNVIRKPCETPANTWIGSARNSGGTTASRKSALI